MNKVTKPPLTPLYFPVSLSRAVFVVCLSAGSAPWCATLTIRRAKSVLPLVSHFKLTPYLRRPRHMEHALSATPQVPARIETLPEEDRTTSVFSGNFILQK